LAAAAAFKAAFLFLVRAAFLAAAARFSLADTITELKFSSRLYG
jgi:hypothetical protein